MNDRIKLCEAMGWIPQPNEPNGEPVWLKGPDGEDPYYLYELPDPFTDANDDYAVLEWMRSVRDECNPIPDDPGWKQWLLFLSADQFNGLNYQIGDYARAALAAIK